MTAYYNEFDPKAAAWLRQLITNGDIAPGEVDERSITEVSVNDLKGFNQHHFFAGIGVWSYALRNAGWSDDRPVWTASLPCQPFSVAGNQKGKDDERHLLPHFIELVKKYRPDAIFGEQVESAIRHGWLDDLQANMEGEGYALGHCVLGAHSVGKAHIRKRLYWVGDSKHDGQFADKVGRSISESEAEGGLCEPERPGADCRLGNPEHDGCTTSETRPSDVQPSEEWRAKGQDVSGELEGASGREKSAELSGCTTGREGEQDSIEWLYCRDNKYRPIKSGLKPLVDGIARGVVHSSDSIITPNDTAEARAQRLKGYGNAIVAPVAEAFIRAFMGI